MQQAIPTLSQSDIAKVMQPHSAQNMILPANKKTKKYAQQVPSSKPQSLQPLQQQQHSHTSQPQFQINKSYNVVSILKTTAQNAQQPQHLTHQQQQQPSHHLQQTQQHQQSYANVVNRSISSGSGTVGAQQSTVICNGSNIMTVNSCQLNSGDLNSTAIYNISSHRALSGSLDGNVRFLSVTDIAKNGNNIANNAVGTGTNNCPGGSNNSQITMPKSHIGNTIGVALGTTTAGTPYMHDSNIVGVSVNCVDTSRKYDFKGSSLISNNSFQASTAEYISTGNNSTGNTRSNPQSGGIFRGPPPTANAARGASGGATRHVHVQPMYSQPLHQNMVIQPFTQYNPRQQTFPSSHLQYAPAPMSYYQYQYMPALQQQPPPHTRSAVTVNANVNVGNSLQPVQSGPNGSLPGPGTTSSQLQLLTSTVQPGTNSVMGVGGPSSGMGQVGVPPMVGVMSAGVQPQAVQVPPTGRRRHQHRLQIIDPTTKKNILDDFDKTNSNTDNDFAEQVTNTSGAVLSEGLIRTPQQDIVEINNLSNIPLQGSESRNNAPYNPVEPISASRQDVGQTPIVSAMSDAPSVEILPTPPRGRSKKIPIVSPKVVSDSTAAPSTDETDDAVSNPIAAITKESLLPNLSDEKLLNSASPQQKPTVPTTEITKEKPIAPEGTKVSDLDSGVSSESPSTDYSVVDVKNSQRLSNVAESDCIDEASPFELNANLPNMHTDIQKSEPSPLTETLDKPSEDDFDVQSKEQHIQSELTSGDVPNVASLSTMVMKENTCLEYSQNEATDINDVDVSNNDSTGEQATESLKPNNDDVDPQADVNPEPKPEDNVDEKRMSANTKLEGVGTTVSSFINYNEGQWSPSNPNGKKQYDRDQLLQLREVKASRMQPEVKNLSILPQPNLMPSFIRNNNNNKRVQSMVGMIGNRNSESGGGNYVGKQISMSGVQGGGGRSSMKGMIHVNLSLNQDVKLSENENAWRPRALNRSDADSDTKATQEKDELIRRVRGILNKLTPERFDTLVEEIIKLKIDTPEKMDEVIVLVFEKAIDEPNFSVSYARLCHRLISEVKARDERMESGTKSNLAHFRNALLDKTEREFTQNVSQSTAKEKKLQPIVDKIKKCTDANEKAELEAFLEEEERKIRRRSGGTVRFIGELFKISMLTGKIIYSCIDTLLNPHSEDMLECLCKLLTTVGAKFEQTPVNSKEPGRCYSLEKSIIRMQAIASKTDKDGAKVSSRVRFMLQDVIDLRKNKWQTSRNEAPKTMGQIEKEAKTEQLSAQYFGTLSGSTNVGSQVGSGKRDERVNTRYGESRSGSGYGGSHSQRGDNGNLRHQQQSNTSGGSGSGGAGHSNGNNDDNTWHVQTSKGSRSQAVDSNKLEGLSKLSDQNLENKKMGGLTQFIWNNKITQQSSAPTSTPSNPFAVLSSLIDKNNTERDRDRDRSGPRNKGSYNKGSMERDRYDRGIHSRTGSSQGSRENSTSRGQARTLLSSSVQKSASHSKYIQQAPPARHTGKAQSSLGNSNMNAGVLYRGSEQPATASSSTFSSTSPEGARSVAPLAVLNQASETELKAIKSVVSEMIELAAASKAVTPGVVLCIKRVPEELRCSFLYYILTDYLHLANVGKQYRRYLAIAVSQLIQQNYISVDHFRLAYNEFSEYANDLFVDIPELWLYILQFAGPLIVKKILTVSDLWNKYLKDNSPSRMAKKFLKTYLIYCTQEVGPNFTRSMWTKFNLKWSDFMPENEVADFIKDNRLEYVEDVSKSPVIERRESPEKHVKNVIDHIEHLLKEGTTADCIIDYSNGNILVVDKLFIRGLTEALSNFSILYKDHSYKLESEIFQKLCIPVLQRYIDSKEDHQLECLYALQLLVHGLEHPRGLLSELIGELYDAYVIQKESLCKWRDSKDQSAGKGVAVKSLNPFINSLFNDEAN